MILHAIDYKGGELWVKENTVTEYPKNKTIYSVRYSDIIDFGNVENSYLNECFAVEAQSPNISLPNIPYVEIEDEESWIQKDSKAGEILNQILKDESENFILYTISPKVLRKLIVAGYEAASAKKYTEEDLRKALQELSNSSYIQESSEHYTMDSVRYTKSFDKIIQSLQPKVVSIEVETTRARFPKGDDGWEDVYTPTTYTKYGKTFLKVKSVNYQ